MKNSWESKINIDEKENVLKAKISKVLDKEIESISNEYQSLGFSGGTFKCSIEFKDGSIQEVILKKVGDPEKEYSFYTEVLPLIDSQYPKCFGTLLLDDNSFIILDYVHSRDVDYKNNKRYREAVYWLINKDLRAIDNKGLIEHPSIQKEPHESYGKKFLDRLDTAIEMNIHPSVNKEFKNTLEIKSEKFLSLNKTLLNSPQTINHNDFQMNNILFKEEDDSIVVIDWTHPNQGSVLVDLMALVGTAPKEIREELISQYREKINFEDFDQLYEAAKVRKNIGVFSWMLKVFIEGQQDQLYMPDFEEFRDSLADF